MGFPVPQVVGPQHLDVGHSVGLRPGEQVGQVGVLRGIARDDDLAQLLVGDAVLGGVLAQQRDAAPAQGRRQRSRLVVHAGVRYTTVVAGLMQPDLVLLLEHDDGAAGAEHQQLAGDCQPDNARTTTM
jgi:hypothetical protein